ncbi:Transposon Tf2-9 polyprotein [Cucumispora dikerogammari]|nr:Transposon Tf2-9 polyprotein [Cucumispora dikerogammari]
MPKFPVIRDEQEKQFILAYLNTGHVPINLDSAGRKKIKRKGKSFVIENGVLFVGSGETKKRYFCSFERREIEEVIERCHLPGHIGMNALREQLSRNYVGIPFENIMAFVQGCVACQRETVPTPFVPLTPIVPSYIRERLMVDTVDLTEYANANDWNRYIFTFIDSFSKFAFVYPSMRRDSGSVLQILKSLFYVEGPWRIFHSDNGGEFTALCIKEFLSSFGTEDRQGAPYRPQTQGQIERFNRTIKSRIRKYLVDGNTRYIDELPHIVYQYNTSRHKATKLSPFVLFRGYDPLDQNWGDLGRHFEIQQLRDRYLRYIEGYRIEYNRRMSTETLSIGDFVIVAREFNPIFSRRIRPLESYYLEGTYEIIGVYTSHFRLKKAGENVEYIDVHKTLVKKFEPRVLVLTPDNR